MAVELGDFHATRRGRAVLVEWQTLAEFKNAGFRVLRQAPAGSLANLTPRLIPARAGGISGAAYSYLDLAAPSEAVRYWLEDVDARGHTTRHGPVVAPPAQVRPIELPPAPGAPPPE
jgi:hypothetical protein